MGTPTKLALMITAVGLTFTGLVTAYFTHFDAQESLALIQQSHQATVKILSRDVDDLRQQLVGIYGPKYAPSLAALTFQKDERGRVGVRGGAPVRDWIPIENSKTSAFRGSLPQKQRVYAEVYDLNRQLLDSTAAPAPRHALAQLTTAIPGSNLILSSRLAPNRERVSLGLLIALAVGFWINAAAFLWLKLDDALATVAASRPAPRPGLFSNPATTALSFQQKKLVEPLRERMHQTLNAKGPLNVVRVSLPDPGVVDDPGVGLSKLISSYGFGGQHVAKADQLLVCVDRDQVTSLRGLLHAMNERLREKRPGRPEIRATESMLLSNVDIKTMIDRLERPAKPVNPRRRARRPYLNERGPRLDFQ